MNSVSITAIHSRMTERSTCWSLTQHVESEQEAAEFMLMPVPPGWKLTGQLEEAPTTRKLHLQLMLETPRIRFGAVKKQFPKAHIEVARNKHQLSLYVKKTDTRVAVAEQPATPTIWEFNTMVAHRIDTQDLNKYLLNVRHIDYTKHADAIYVDREWVVMGDIWKSVKPNEMLEYIDTVIMEFISEGVRGAEYMGVNPMFRSAWKTYGVALIERAAKEKSRIEYIRNAEGSHTDEGSVGCEITSEDGCESD